MLNIRLLRVFLVFCVMAFSLGACSQSESDGTSVMLGESDLLQYVPADTPYVFAAPEPPPQDVLDKMAPFMETMLGSYKHAVELLSQDLSKKILDAPDGVDKAAKLEAVFAIFAKLLDGDALSEAGLSLKLPSAFYGVGLLPVLRVELEDSSVFETFVADIEEDLDMSMSVATLDGQDYRYAGDENARLVLAVIDPYLVMSIVPTTLSDEGLSAVLGMTLPEQDIVSSGDLAKLAKDYGYLSHALGFVDVERIAATFLDEQSGVNAELLALTEFDRSALSDVCQTEIRGMAGVAPRLVVGYTEMSVDAFRSSMIIEIRSDIAAGLSKLAAAVPGLGIEHDGLLSFGMSLDVLAAREFYSARLDALEADPYECELFADLQNGVEQGRALLNQPVPPIVYGFKGFLAVIDSLGDFDLATKRPPTEVEMQLVVAIDNAPGLLAMGTMFSPDLAALNLQADGEPVKFDMPMPGMQFGDIYIAMTDDLLGLSIGNDAASGLGELLAAKSGEPPPIMGMSIDAATYYELMGEAMLVNEGGTDDAGVSAEVAQAMNDAMTAAGSLLDRMSVNITATERGIEFVSTVTLAD